MNDFSSLISTSLSSWIRQYLSSANLYTFKEAFILPFMRVIIQDNEDVTYYITFWIIIGILFFNTVLKIFNSFRKVRL